MSSAVHRRTPALAVIDGRGLPIRQIAYLRSSASDTAIALKMRQQHNTAGHRVAQWDPRLPTPNLTTVFTLAGEALKIDSVDAGWRLSLPGLAGQALQRWDGRGSHWRIAYDDLLRVVAVEENAVPDYEVFTYATAAAGADHNLRGNLIALHDSSGRVDFHDYSLLGQALDETRTFDDGQTFTSRRIHGPSGAVLEQTDAGGHQQQSRFDVAGQLQQVQLQLSGQTHREPILHNAHYNAAGQIIAQQAGNGVISRWSYDPANGELQRQTAQKEAGPILQDFEYTYDPVGNLTRILDHVLSPSHFANQRVDGHREFTYDSLYRLVRASGFDDGPPSDTPGLPQPTDPADRRNYFQTYAYDAGDNLIEMVHVRDGASHTRTMFIDPASNKGVRWKTGDPLPDFGKLFDRNGNLQALQPGQDLQWNATDELKTVTLVKRESGIDDAEHYRYSQGARVHKRLETATGHFHDVRYLPGLEIRSKDNGEELHVITLAAGIGNVRCLHWVAGKPAGIAADQLRYSLEDHLGSCLIEVDQQAQVISQEGYYPFGATAWMAARSTVEADYKTVRYSGKEMDVSGLYYYGARYYAPWLQRWISADPAGDVDGLNLYGFVGNNPLRYFDNGGTTKTPSEHKKTIEEEEKFLSSIPSRMDNVKKTLGDLTSPASFRVKMLTNFLYLAGRASAGFFSGYHASSMLPTSIPGELQGLTVGNATADGVNTVYAQIFSRLNAPILPRSSDLDIQSLRDRSSGKSASPLDSYTVAPATWPERSENIRALFSFGRDSVGGALIPGVSELAELFKLSKDATKAEQLLNEFEMDLYDSMLDRLHEAILRSSKAANVAFDALGVEQVYTNTVDYLKDIGQGRVAASNSRMIHLSAIKSHTEVALKSVVETKAILSRYRAYVAQETVKRAA